MDRVNDERMEGDSDQRAKRIAGLAVWFMGLAAMCGFELDTESAMAQAESCDAFLKEYFAAHSAYGVEPERLFYEGVRAYLETLTSDVV
jgi:hypothetical protein